MNEVCKKRCCQRLCQKLNVSQWCQVVSRRTLTSQTRWKGLEAFASDPVAVRGWKRLKAADLKAQSLIDKHLVPRLEGRPRPTVNWKHWQSIIKHRAIVDSLRSLYEQNVALLDEAITKETARAYDTSSTLQPEATSDSWASYDKAVEACKAAVATSAAIVKDGSRALWVSHHNPLAEAVATEEWLDSDKYWQAYVERHHFYDPAKDIEEYKAETFEDDAKAEADKKLWHKRVNLFHDRSDTPTLYTYMDQLYSSDYYDLHRRVFLEHMLYFLIRTGNSYHFFPEIPPTDWIVHLDLLRYRYLKSAHARRVARQVEKYSQEEALDLCPLDSDMSHAEEHFFQLFTTERTTWETAAATLMADYCFLTHPAIPVQSLQQLNRAVMSDDGRGQIYTFEPTQPQIAALFYVPYGVSPPFSESSCTSSNTTALLPPRPHEAIDTWLEYLRVTGKPINPGYAELMALYAEVLEKRGDFWFSAPGEAFADAFLRKFLREDEPSFAIFRDYVEELKMLWKNHATPITLEEALTKIEFISKTARDTQAIAAMLDDPQGSLSTENEKDNGVLLSALQQLEAPGDLEDAFANERIFLSPGTRTDAAPTLPASTTSDERTGKKLRQSTATTDCLLEMVQGSMDEKQQLTKMFLSNKSSSF